jgi:protein-S-isoprenylcysteine O-methyltransferase Ste14
MTWRVARAILAMPFVATVVIPAIILAGGGGWSWELGDGARAATIAVGALLVGSGLALFVATVRLFATEGGGTLAPWDPPRKLVIRGPYRHLRHPMITGVALVIAGEALLFASTAIAVELAVFAAVNAVYLPLVEEPGLIRRFGADYERYMDEVGRLLPRLRG